MRRLFLVLMLALFSTALAGETPLAEGAKPTVSFRSFDIWIDSGAERLAAYQAEVGYPRDSVKVVGVEGGEAKAYQDAPCYDELGMEGGKIILAAFTTDDRTAPQGRVRVARLHLRVEGKEPPALSVRPVTAAKPGGEKIEPKAEIVPTPAPAADTTGSGSSSTEVSGTDGDSFGR
ncbi:MAG: hypothetical protein V1918_02845 [Planctomycetota bacterium]